MSRSVPGGLRMGYEHDVSATPPGRPLLHGGVALLERHELLEPQATSPGRARRLVREVLAEVDRPQWVDATELAVSEVVTNAALHAHTPIEVRVGVFEDEVCVEVEDFDPTLPVQRHYEDEATTGRGMGLVAAMTRSCGVHSLGAGGKIVWFCVGDAGAASDPADLFAAWDLDDLLEQQSTTPMCDVSLLGMPPTLWLSARQHHDAIIRDLVLYQASRGGPSPDIAVADAARSTISTAVVAAVEAAQRAGDARSVLPDGHPSRLPWVPAHLDLRVKVAADSAGSFATMQDVLDMAEALAVAGELLVRPGLPEIIAVRDWACEQVIAQLGGSPPAPWPGTAQEQFETAVHDRDEESVWDSAAVSGAMTRVIAVDEANRIVAVSRPLADVLGWGVDDLVGRRVVTIIPRALREAHVAGFSRHLSTGEAHVLGVPLDLPVLRRDGAEVTCHFMIERTTDPSGRSVYVAAIDPVDSPNAAS